MKVVKASGTKVRRTAKPRPATKPPTKPPAKPPAAKKATERPATAPAKKAQERAKLAGRRGGLGYYRNRIRRAG